MSETERLAPEIVLVQGDDGYAYRPVVRTIIEPPHNHFGKRPVRPDLYAVVLVADNGRERVWGFESAWIGADLRVHVDGYGQRNEIISAWERPQ